MGFTLTEWTLFYGGISLTAWALHSATRSRWTFEEWYEFYRDEEPGTAYEWACWTCGVLPDI